MGDAGAELDLTEADSGTEREARVAQPIRISLPETRTTGYRWYPTIEDDALQLTEDVYGAGEAPGAPGRRVMRFVARRPGRITLRLVKRRDWNQDVAGEFAVRLHVV